MHIPPDGSGGGVTSFRRILRNSATLIAARVVSKFAMTLFMIVLARRLGAESFGVYSSIIAFIAFFSLVEEFGLTQPMIRRIARNRGEGTRILGEVLAVKAALGVGAYLLLLGTSIGLGVSPEITAVLGLSMILEILALTVTRAFEAYERMREVAIITIAERSLLCSTGIAAVFLGGSLAWVAAAYLVTFAGSLALATTMFGRAVGPIRVRPPRDGWRPMLREAAPFLVSSVLSIVWTRVDIYLLTSFRSAQEVGWYNAALRVVEAQIFIPVAILGSVFPVLSRLEGGSRAEFNGILGKNFLFLAALGGLIAAGTWLFAPEIIDLLFGVTYIQSAEVLRIFSPMIALAFLNYLFSGALIAMGREVIATITLGLGAAVCVTLGFAAIPAWGAPAAGAIKLGAETVAFLFQGSILLWLVVRGAGDAAGTAARRPGGLRGESADREYRHTEVL